MLTLNRSSETSQALSYSLLKADSCLGKVGFTRILLALWVFLAPGAGAIPAAEASKKKTSGAGAEPGKKPGGDIDEAPLFAINMHKSDYIEKLAKMDPKEATQGNIVLKASVVPDAYRYFMARELARLEEAGFQGAKLEEKMRAAHGANKKHMNKVLFFVTASASGADAYLILTKKLSSHLALAQKTSKTFSILRTDPKPDMYEWKCFDGTGQGFKKRALCVVRKIEMELTSGSVRTFEKEPIRLSLVDAGAQAKSDDPNYSINLRERQISHKHWNEMFVKDLSVSFTPGTWKKPRPPKGFEELLERFEGR